MNKNYCGMEYIVHTQEDFLKFGRGEETMRTVKRVHFFFGGGGSNQILGWRLPPKKGNADLLTPAVDNNDIIQ